MVYGKKVRGFVLLMMGMALNLAALGGKDNQTDKANFKIGVAKIVSHPALDEVEKGIISVVKAKYPEAQFDLQNANGNVGEATGIARKFKSDKVDIAVGIATPTAVALATVLKEIPVIYSAVTDPIAAGLVDTLDKGGNMVTGVSDMTPVREQVKLLKEIMDLKVLGHIYTSSEVNAVTLAAILDQVCQELGIELIVTTVTNSSEVQEAAKVIARRVEAIYVSTDNTVFSAMPSINSVAKENNIPILASDVHGAKYSHVLLALGFDYLTVGKLTGELVLEILGGKLTKDIPMRTLTGEKTLMLYFNQDLAEEMGEKIAFPLSKNFLEKVDILVKDGKETSSLSP